MQGVRHPAAAPQGPLLRHLLHLRYATEVTAFSIITDYQKGIKYPIADFEITPDVAIVDPELAHTMPKKLVAHTGMDAMTHAIEPTSPPRTATLPTRWPCTPSR